MHGCTNRMKKYASSYITWGEGTIKKIIYAVII